VITFACPHCQKLIEVQQDLLGSTVPCPHCAHQVKVTLDILFSEQQAATPSSSFAPAYAGPQSGKLPFVPQTPVPVPSGQSKHASLIQAACAVGLMAVFYIMAFILARAFGSQFSLAEKLTDRGWTPYACVLLTCWSVCILVTKWRLAGKRAKCVAASSIPPSVSLGTELGCQEATSTIWAVARQHGDDLLARRVQKLIGHFRTSRSPEAVADALNVESDSAFGELEASYTLVRVFLWTIPILGFIGTVMGIGAAVGGFASFLSVGAQELDDIKTALTKVTASLAVAFDTTLVALLLSVVVMLVMSWVESREKGLLQLVDDFCRDRLLPPMRIARAQVAAAAEDGFARGAGVLRDAIGELRSSLVGFAQNAGAEWATQFAQASAAAGSQWMVAIEELRVQQAKESAQSVELAQRQLENGNAIKEELAHRLQEIQQLLADLCKKTEVAIQTGQQSMPESRGVNALSPQAQALADVVAKLETFVGVRGPVGAMSPAVGADGVSAVLQELQEGLHGMQPFMQALAERLRVLAAYPEDVKLKVVMRSNGAAVE
jgi:biopolymer transport protein ExbB/TolQ